MSFWTNLFKKQHSESVVLFNIGADSVAGAYARYESGKEPALIYARRLPVEIRRDEPADQAMLRALKILGSDLIHDGAPLLVRAAGKGSVSTIFISIDAPWQKTSIHTEHFEQKMPFVFNKQMMRAALKKTDSVPQDQMLVNESVIGVVLNGYETRNPYGKKAHRASVSVLASYGNERIAKDIHATLRSVYHTKNIACIAGSSLRCQAIQAVFPHEHDALILDALGSQASIALIRRGLLAEIVDTSATTAHPAVWLKEVSTEFAKIAEQFPLPRTIFLLAHESTIAALREVLGTANFGKLWLSDNPPKIISVLGSHVTALVRQTATTPPDLSLLLTALYFKEHKMRDIS